MYFRKNYKSEITTSSTIKMQSDNIKISCFYNYNIAKYDKVSYLCTFFI